MTKYLSEPPPDMEVYLDYIVKDLNKFIGGLSDVEILIDSIEEADSESYDNRVTLRLKQANPYDSGDKDIFSEQMNKDEEDICIYLEDDEYLHILTSTKDWSKFDQQKISELCIDTILSEKPS